MRSKMTSEQLRPFMLAFIIVGVVALLFGGYRFIDAVIQIQNNQSFQVQQSGQEVAPQSAGEAQGLFASGVQYHALVGQRNESLVIAGAGLIMLSIGWLGNDAIRSRHKVVQAS
jgi:hypothetical protein